MPRTARSATTTTDHDEIRNWVEERGGSPAAVQRATRGDAGILRIDFPGFTGKNLKHISWDEWFKTFDEAGLAFLHRGQDRFNKIVRRRGGARAGGAGEEGRTAKGASTKRATTSRSSQAGAKRATTSRSSRGGSKGDDGGGKTRSTGRRTARATAGTETGARGTTRTRKRG